MRYVFWALGLVILILLANWTYQTFTSNDEMDANTAQVEVFFNENQPTDIVQVGVERTVPATSNVEDLAEAAMRELLGGPTDKEAEQGLTTAIADGTHLNYVNIVDGVATVDFNEAFDFQIGGSARVMAISQQVQKTLTQFTGVNDVRITINHGAREAVLEP
ncbi:MAG: GerMN domain-containing protein [Patescibacteria group bacterium]|nr:GerMN domain-containing protein [Patescibacteria group bacterium]